MVYHETGTWDLGWKFGVISELPPPKYPRLISTVAFAGERYAEHGMVDYDVRGNRLIGPAQPVDMRDDPHRVTRPGDSVQQFHTQPFSEAMSFEVANELTRRFAGMPSNAAMTQVIRDGYDKRVVEGLRTLMDRVDYHMQLIAWSFAVGNGYNFDGVRYTMRLTGLRDAALEVTLTGDDRWGKTNGDPVGNIRALMDTMADKGGVRPDILLMSSGAFAEAMKDTAFEKMWSTNLSYNPHAIIPWSGRVKARDAAEAYSVPVEGRILGMDVVIASEQTTHLDSNVPFIGANGVLLLNRAAWAGPQWYGPIYNQYAVERGMTGVPWFPFEETMDYGRGLELVLETNRVWIPGNFNASAYLNIDGGT